MMLRIAGLFLALMLLGLMVLSLPMTGPQHASATTAVKISAGMWHACAVTSTGGAQCWGYNGFGEQGDGTTTHHLTPGNVSNLTSGVEAVSAGGNHTCALTTATGVKCWGFSELGQLGNGNTSGPDSCGGRGCSTTPVGVSGLSFGVAAVSAGGSHTCALTTGGGVKCWGFNGYGQLGNGTTTDSSTPVDVTGLTSGVASVAAGSRHTCVVMTAGGGVKCWGASYSGQLGNGTSTGPESCPTGGTSWSCSKTPVDVSGMSSGVDSVAVGGIHTCARSTAGAVKCWGETIGDPQTINPETCTVDLGFGFILSWGCSTTPRDVPGLSSSVAALAADGGSSCVRMANSGVKCWGANDRGQVGDGTTTDRPSPVDVSGLAAGVTSVEVGGGHACAVTTEGGVKCWGLNDVGELGIGTSTGPETCSGDPCSTVPLDVLDLGLIQGDVDCNGGVTSVDSLKELRFVAQLSVSQTEPCPNIGEDVASVWGDVDCNLQVNSVDALKILRFVAGLSVIQLEPCPDIGTDEN